MLLNYLRVSSVDQILNHHRNGVAVEHFHQDKTSGPELAKAAIEQCLRNVRGSDVLVLHGNDSLASNLYYLQLILKELGGNGMTGRFLKERLDSRLTGK